MLAEKVASRMHIRFFNKKKTGSVCIQQQQNFTLNYGKYEPFRGGCSTLGLPKWIADKKAAISIITGGQKCFYWCILRHFNPRIKDRGRVDKTLKRIEKEEPNKYAYLKRLEQQKTIFYSLFSHWLPRLTKPTSKEAGGVQWVMSSLH